MQLLHREESFLSSSEGSMDSFFFYCNYIFNGEKLKSALLCNKTESLLNLLYYKGSCISILHSFSFTFSNTFLVFKYIVLVYFFKCIFILAFPVGAIPPPVLSSQRPCTVGHRERWGLDGDHPGSWRAQQLFSPWSLPATKKGNTTELFSNLSMHFIRTG